MQPRFDPPCEHRSNFTKRRSPRKAARASYVSSVSGLHPVKFVVQTRQSIAVRTFSRDPQHRLHIESERLSNEVLLPEVHPPPRGEGGVQPAVHAVQPPHRAPGSSGGGDAGAEGERPRHRREPRAGGRADRRIPHEAR